MATLNDVNRIQIMYLHVFHKHFRQEDVQVNGYTELKYSVIVLIPFENLQTPGIYFSTSVTAEHQNLATRAP